MSVLQNGISLFKLLASPNQHSGSASGSQNDMEEMLEFAKKNIKSSLGLVNKRWMILTRLSKTLGLESLGSDLYWRINSHCS